MLSENLLISRSSPEISVRGTLEQYGYVRWQPNSPPGETEVSLEEKQKEIKELHSCEGPAGVERNHLTHFIQITYYKQ